MTNPILDYHHSTLKFIPKVFLPNVVFFDQFQKIAPLLADKKMYLLCSKTVFDAHTSVLSSLNTSEGYLYFVPAEPKSETLDACLNKIANLKKKPEIVIAVGGGSVIDVAKLIKRSLHLPLVAVPTTPNTGTEVTPYAVVTRQEQKVAENDPHLLPEMVVLDSIFLTSLTLKKLGPMLIDIYSHAVEGFFSRMANPFTDAMAKMCIEMLTQNIEGQLLTKPFWKTMQVTGLVGGLCQAGASTGMAHALAHFFGPKLGISHGDAIALFIKQTITINSANTSVDQKMKEHHLSRERLLGVLGKIYTTCSYEEPNVKLPQPLDVKNTMNMLYRDMCMLTNPVRPTPEQLEPLITSYL